MTQRVRYPIKGKTLDTDIMRQATSWLLRNLRIMKTERRIGIRLPRDRWGKE